MKRIILFVLVCLSVFLCLHAGGKREVEIFIHSGPSFPLTPEFFPVYWAPAFSIGGGVGITISPKIILRGSFNYYSFHPKIDYFQYLQIGDNIIDISDWGWYCGNRFFAFYNLFIEPKFLIKKGRLSPYITASVGVTINRKIMSEYFGIDGSYRIIGTWWHFVYGAGLGLEYRFKRNISLFVEPEWLITFRNEDGSANLSSLIIKCGIIYHF